MWLDILSFLEPFQGLTLEGKMEILHQQEGFPAGVRPHESHGVLSPAAGWSDTKLHIIDQYVNPCGNISRELPLFTVPYIRS